MLLVTGLLWRAARKVTHLVVFPWVAPLSLWYLEYICQNLTCGCWSLGRRARGDHPTEPNSTPNGEYIFHICDIGIACETQSPSRNSLLPLRCIHSLNGFRSPCLPSSLCVPCTWESCEIGPQILQWRRLPPRKIRRKHVHACEGRRWNSKEAFPSEAPSKVSFVETNFALGSEYSWGPRCNLSSREGKFGMATRIPVGMN